MLWAMDLPPSLDLLHLPRAHQAHHAQAVAQGWRAAPLPHHEIDGPRPHAGCDGRPRDARHERGTAIAAAAAAAAASAIAAAAARRRAFLFLTGASHVLDPAQQAAAGRAQQPGEAQEEGLGGGGMDAGSGLGTRPDPKSDSASSSRNEMFSDPLAFSVESWLKESAETRAALRRMSLEANNGTRLKGWRGSEGR